MAIKRQFRLSLYTGRGSPFFQAAAGHRHDSGRSHSGKISQRDPPEAQCSVVQSRGHIDIMMLLMGLLQRCADKPQLGAYCVIESRRVFCLPCTFCCVSSLLGLSFSPPSVWGC